MNPSYLSLIHVLGLVDRASGVLKYVSIHYPHIDIEPQWLQKLHFWQEARESYRQQNTVYSEATPSDRPPANSAWMASELGNLQCLLALGEFEQLAESSSVLMNHLKCCPSVEHYNPWMSEVQKLGANASWMLGNWSSLESFLEGDILVDAHDVELNNNASFYRAILAIHKEHYAQASQLIMETRAQLCSAISSLLSESYSRAYRAMVSMQILAG